MSIRIGAVADPVVVLVAPAVDGGAAVKERLSSLGIRCELIDSTGPSRGWRAADGDLLLVFDPEGASSNVPVLLSRRACTRLEELPLVVMCQASSVSSIDSSHVDG